MLGVERLLSSSQAERGETRFLDGTKRTYTRDTWYAREEADFCADDYDEPLDVARTGPRTRLADVWGTDDTFEEGGYRPMVVEQPGVIAQLRTDVASDAMRVAMERGRLHRPEERRRNAAGEQTQRARAAIVQAMAVRQSEQLLFSTDFASSVPPEFRDEFLSAFEVECVESVLSTQLYSLVAGGGGAHTHQCAVVRELAAVGCEFVSATDHTLDAPLRRHMLAVDANAFVLSLDTEHAHRVDDAHAIRVLVFRIPTANAGFDAEAESIERQRRRLVVGDEDEDDDEEEEVAHNDPRGYRVRVVYHLVEHDKTPTDDATDMSLLCFRTFQFSR